MEEIKSAIGVENEIQSPRPWPKVLFSVLGLFLAGGVALAAIQIGKKQPSQIIIQPTPTLAPIAIPTSRPEVSPSSAETANWKTYQDKTLSFRYPQDWTAEPQQVPDLILSVEFKYNLTPTLTLTEKANLNNDTGKPFATLDEYLSGRGNNENITVGGYPAKKITGKGIEGHVLPYEEVTLFTPNRSVIVSLYYNEGYYEVPGANRVLDQILSTFKSLD
jgi:hypothetical protein